jgi:hypothetical protein
MRWVPITLTLGVLLVSWRPILGLLWDSYEAWGYARINGLSMNLARRLLYYSAAGSLGVAAAITLIWSLT